MLDIHSHLLPGVDDGAEDLEEACMMARSAWDTGTKGLVLTPHCNVPGGYRNPWDSALSHKLETFRQALVRLGIPLQLMMGAEVFGTDDVALGLSSGRILTLNGGRHVLLEFWTEDQPLRVNRVLDSISALGLVPVIAHPERYRFVQSDLDLARRWYDRGYLLQINKGSILGLLGRRSQAAADALLSARLAHVVASDSHSPYQRTPTLHEAYVHIAERYSRAYADSLLRETPRCIVSNA